MKKTWIILAISGILISCTGSGKKFKSYEEFPVYEGNDLELTYSPSGSKFRVWSPAADEVKLLLFDNGLDGSAYEMKDMKRSKSGTWIANVKGDLKGKYYTFQVKMGERDFSQQNLTMILLPKHRCLRFWLPK